MNAVSDNMNNIYAAFRKRNPSFRGSVSVCGHSLGSLILFDLLQHQKPPKHLSTDKDDVKNAETTALEPTVRPPLLRALTSQQINYTIGPAGTGQAFITYPKLEFQPKMFFALGLYSETIISECKLHLKNYFFNRFAHRHVRDSSWSRLTWT